MILITGATGFLGTAVMETLLKTIEPAGLAVYARDEHKAKKWKEIGVAVKIGDFNNSDALDSAFHGITKLLLIPINDETAFEQHKNVIDAALKANVKHLYYAGQ